MYKPALRLASSAARALPRSATGRRFVSTAPPHKTSRSWKSSAARWGLAGAGVYYYNTASVFAEEPAYAIHAPPETPRETETYPTIESISEQRRAQSRTPTQEAAAPQSSSVAIAPDGATAAPGGPGELAEEAGQEGAFNEETGEINWDCPCLGGMATGPCGEQFKAAFSCFVFSKEEPKGVDCIEHFKTMQGCFREHPDIYGSELDDEQMEEAQTADENAPAGSYPTPSEPAPAAAPSLAAADNSPQGQSEKIAHVNSGPDSEHGTKAKRERAQAAAQQVEQDHGEKEVITESYEDAESYKHVPKA